MKARELPPVAGEFVGAQLVLGALLALVFWMIPSPSFAGTVLGQYGLFIILAARPCTWLFHGQEETVSMWLRGFSRAHMARLYLGKMAFASVAQGSGLFAAWSLSGAVPFPALGLEGPGLEIKVLYCILACQIIFRSILLLIVNAPNCATVPIWARRIGPPGDLMGWWPMRVIPVAIVLAAIPLVLAFMLGPIPGLLGPAILGPALLYSMVRSMEFANLAGPRRGRSTPAAPRLVAEPFGPKRALLGPGLAAWVKGLAYTVIPLTLIAYFIGLAVGGPERKILVFSVGAYLILVLTFGGLAFRWSSYGPTGEWLYMAGVRTSTTRRIKLAASAALILLSITFGAGAFHVLAKPTTAGPQLVDFLKTFVSLYFLGLAAHLLLWTNECPIARTRTRWFRGSHLAVALRGLAGLAVVIIVILEKFGSVEFRQLDTPWLGLLGLAVLAISAAVWMIGWLRTSDETTDREDAFQPGLPAGRG